MTAATDVTANFDNTVDAKELKFRFKKDKLENQRPTVELKAGVPSVEGIQNILRIGGKGLDLLLEAVQDVVRSAIASDVGDDEKFSQATYENAFLTLKGPDGAEYKVHKYSWEGIANQPREDRRSIPDEQWTAFTAEYMEIMPGITGKSKEAVETAAFIFAKKFTIVKTNKDVLNMLKGQLGLFIEHSKKGEQFMDVLELLTKRLETYLSANDVELLIKNL